MSELDPAAIKRSDRNKHGLTRDIPNDVKRKVRQRDGFGCVICGSAFYTYEHFDPEFVEAENHDPHGICLLCGTCHRRKTSGLSRALKSLYRVRQVAFVFTGSDIPHTHGHIVPMHEKTNITSRLYIAEEHLTFRYVAQAPLEERAVIAEQIRAMLPVS